MTRYDQIRRLAGMRHETVRNELGKARRAGRPLTDAEHLALHEATFRAGAEAMASAIQAELASLRVQEAEELDQLAGGGVVAHFPFPGTEHRFRNWNVLAAGFVGEEDQEGGSEG